MAVRVACSCGELRRLYIDDGLGVVAIAARLGCSPPTVSNWLRRCGIPARASRFRARPVAHEELERLYSVEGLTLRAIAVRLGVSIGTVNNRLRAYGIPRRSARAGRRAPGGGAP